MSEAAAEMPTLAREGLDVQPEVDGAQIRKRVLLLGAVILTVVAVIALVPGLAGLRSPSHMPIRRGVGRRRPEGAVGRLLCRRISIGFCERMPWKLSGRSAFPSSARTL